MQLESMDAFSAGQDSVRTFHTRDLVSLQLGSTSKGNQRKWYYRPESLWVKEQFYYQDKYWKDYLVELIASKIAAQMNLHGIKVVEQFECKIVDDQTKEVTSGVSSKDFRNNNEFVSFYRVLQNLGEQFPHRASIAEKWKFTLEILDGVTGVDCTDYLIVMVLLDYLVGNEDRHLNNFGVMSDNSVPPLFDFGLGMFEHDLIYEELHFGECIKKMECKPFHRSGRKVIDFLKKRIDTREYLPEVLNLNGVQFPSVKAREYLRTCCFVLGIDLRGC